MTDKLTPAIEPRLERLARTIAFSVCNVDVDLVVVPSWPVAPSVRGGFTLVPQHGLPLWMHFIETARVVLAIEDLTRADPE